MRPINADAQKLRHVTLLPYCRCLQRIRKFETGPERQAFLTKVKRRYANLDRTDEKAVEQIEFDLGL